jgi:hypothetical protein
MKKTMLDPAQLRVQTFAPAAAQAGRAPRAAEATVTCLYPQCGTVVRAESCYSGCTDPEFC